MAIGSALLVPLHGQGAPRLNRVIEQVERDEAALTGQHWQFIDIESAPGVNNVEEIVSVPGIGALFIGPADLAMSLGVGPPGPTHAPETEEAIQTVLRACLAAGVTCGIAESNTRAEQRIAEGFRVLLAF